MATKITVNGTDYDNFTDLIIEDNLNSEVNTADFVITDTIANKPQERWWVEIYLDTTKIFAGRIVEVAPERLNSTSFAYNVSCSDYTVDLQNMKVTESYTSTSPHDIIEDIIITQGYASGITTNNVIDSGVILAGVKFNYLTVQECLEKLAGLTGWDWYVDYDKDLHFFPENTESAPIELVDNATNFENLKINFDKTQIKNRIYIRGGYYLSSVYTQDTIIAIAGQTEFPFTYAPYSPVTVTVNAGATTIGIENIDTAGTKNFMMNQSEKILRTDTIVMAGAEAVIMTYKRKIPLLAMVENIASQQAIIALEGGGDGIIEDIITDNNIVEIDVARERGKAELMKYSNSIITGGFETFTGGFVSGQLLHINLTDRNINNNFLIRRVTTEMVGGNQMKYTIEFATLLLGLNQLLMKLLDKSREIVERDDEVIDRLRTIYENTGFVVETSVTTSFHANDYRWASTNPATDAYWSLFQWM